MRVELAKYPAYKPSGVEWAGRIPINWILIRLRYVASVKARLGWKGLTASEYVEAGNIFLSTPDIKAASIDFENANFITDERYFESPEIMLQVGDVLLVKDGATLGIVNLVRQLPARATVNGSIAVIRTKHNLTPNFLFYFLKSHYLQNLIQQVKGGMGVPHLFQSDIVKFPLLIPPVEEQKQIVTFLDRETAKIDRLMAVRRKQVERLQEQRTAVIHHAVTQGLDSQAEMKPSGNPWLEGIPSHWNTYRLKFIAKLNPSKSASGYAATQTEKVIFLPMEAVSVDGKVDQSNRERICDLWKGFTYFAKGDVLVAKITPCFENGKGAVVSTLETDIGFGTTEFHVIRANNKLVAEFLYQITASYRFRGIGARFMTGAAGQQRVPQQFIADFPIALPPPAEQQAIVDHIRIETAKLDTLITKYQREQELLAEYRASLISHAVTGKIDVRGLVDPAPCVLHRPCT